MMKVTNNNMTHRTKLTNNHIINSLKPFSLLLFMYRNCIYLEYWTIEKVQESIYSEYNTLSSEPFRFQQRIVCDQLYDRMLMTSIGTILWKHTRDSVTLALNKHRNLKVYLSCSVSSVIIKHTTFRKLDLFPSYYVVR